MRKMRKERRHGSSWLCQTANEKLNIFNHAHNLLIDIGSLTLKKETVEHSGRTLVLLNMMLNLIFVAVFVDCFFFFFLNTHVQSDFLYALVFICAGFWNGDAASCSLRSTQTSLWPPGQTAFHLVPQKA